MAPTEITHCKTFEFVYPRVDLDVLKRPDRTGFEVLDRLDRPSRQKSLAVVIGIAVGVAAGLVLLLPLLR